MSTTIGDREAVQAWTPTTTAVACPSTPCALAPRGELGQAGPPDPGQSPPTLRVLVVDDEKDTAETACQLLRLWGNESWAACDGATAVEAARVGAPNVVLLDIGLPDLDGLEVARRMRAQAAAHPPLLVAVTGYGSAADRERTAQAGFDLHLVKPVEPDCLRDLLVTYRRTLRAEQAPAAPPTGAAPAVTASGRESVPADGAHPVLTALESEIQRRLGSRVRGLRILVRSGMAVLRGRACSYYVKQLAQHAVMELSALTIHANEIEVE